ncbi:hypothetical protein DVH24_017614 [Malus domestica]|uniref:RNase H type-1 domain-containing protein n=1 Tax=Malus domestica TaxID=3750 RepID=A0A498KJ20_MALDO|nr:hypothetical protein DVH24_017614 [Malus domestica]
MAKEGAAFSGHYGYMFDDTRRLLQDFKQRKIIFGRRETNKVAHRLARFNLTIDHLVSWFEEPPDRIVLVVNLVWDALFPFDRVENPGKVNSTLACIPLYSLNCAKNRPDTPASACGCRCSIAIQYS